MINIELEPVNAVWVLQALIDAQKGFTQDPVCVPERIVIIRDTIKKIDEALEASKPLGMDEC
jgi:hypothetical protein